SSEDGRKVKHEEETASDSPTTVRDRGRSVQHSSFNGLLSLLSRMRSLAPFLGGLAGLVYALAFFAYFFSFSTDFPNGQRISLELALMATLLLLLGLSIEH